MYRESNIGSERTLELNLLNSEAEIVSSIPQTCAGECTEGATGSHRAEDISHAAAA